MKFATFAFSFGAFVCSAATLGIVVYGGKRMQDKMVEVESKTSKTVSKLKSAINELEL